MSSKHNLEVMTSSISNEYATPQDFFDELDREFGFTLDPCSTHKNAKCPKHFTKAENGLFQDWVGETVFMNPPYGRETPNWIKKAFIESLKGATVVCLIVPATDRSYWHDYIFPYAAQIRFVRGRLKFNDGKESAPFPSAVVIFTQKIKYDRKYCFFENSIADCTKRGKKQITEWLEI